MKTQYLLSLISHVLSLPMSVSEALMTNCYFLTIKAGFLNECRFFTSIL